MRIVGFDFLHSIVEPRNQLILSFEERGEKGVALYYLRDTSPRKPNLLEHIAHFFPRAFGSVHKAVAIRDVTRSGEIAIHRWYLLARELNGKFFITKAPMEYASATEDIPVPELPVAIRPIDEAKAVRPNFYGHLILICWDNVCKRYLMNEDETEEMDELWIDYSGNLVDVKCLHPLCFVFRSNNLLTLNVMDEKGIGSTSALYLDFNIDLASVEYVYPYHTGTMRQEENVLTDDNCFLVVGRDGEERRVAAMFCVDPEILMKDLYDFTPAPEDIMSAVNLGPIEEDSVVGMAYIGDEEKFGPRMVLRPVEIVRRSDGFVLRTLDSLRLEHRLKLKSRPIGIIPVRPPEFSSYSFILIDENGFRLVWG